jgi:class 3 adenylate cyclase/uncharacterized protein HemY
MTQDPEVVQQVLALLRQWGWETGYKKLQAQLMPAEDARWREVQEFFLGWMAGERGEHAEALAHFDRLADVPSLAGWALLGQAFVRLRTQETREAERLLTEAERLGGDDTMLAASVLHARGRLTYRQGDADTARRLLREALEKFGDCHFGMGRVLDTLGMLYTGTDNFHAAQEFFRQSLDCKVRTGDEAGQAVSHGQLGRLYLDWGLLDRAEYHFQEDLRISQRIGDERGQAQMYGALGRVALARGTHHAALGKSAEARKAWETAGGWLDAGIRRSQGCWPHLEAYARKDRALACLAVGDLSGAEEQLRLAEGLCDQLGFAQGRAHVDRTRGILACHRGEFEPALALLRRALKYFLTSSEAVETARTLLEVARAYRAGGEPRPLVSQALQEALRAAEACRRAELVRAVEAELQAVDSETHCAHVYARVRGKSVDQDTTSLMAASREVATVLYLDLAGSTSFALGRDPEEVMLTLNQMMADLVGVLRRYDAPVSAFRGDGFLALLRGPENAARAVDAALDLFAAMATFNEPRAILGLPEFVVRIGIATGEVCLGNLGTYDKMSYTAIGTTANLGARLEAEAEPGLPCVSRGTFELVRERFTFKPGNPRRVNLKGLGEQEVWDVVGRRGP